MANPIVSAWTSCTTSTSYQDGQTTTQWVDAHVARADSNALGSPPDHAYPITTTWTSGGVGVTVSTPHQGTETDKEWLDRHFVAVRAAMQTQPPDHA